MKIRFSALILLLLFSLSSCASLSYGATNKIKIVYTNTGNSYTELIISTEIQPTEVNKAEPFEMQVGFGQMFGMFDYREATFEISAMGLTITLSDGSSFKDSYERSITDFNQSQYGYDKENKMPSHIETIRFMYTGAKEEYNGKISFYIRATIPKNEDGTNNYYNTYTDGKTMNRIEIYYLVRGDTIWLTQRQPKSYSNLITPY